MLDRIHRIYMAIWETGEWPEEWTFSTFIPLPSKGDLNKLQNDCSCLTCKQDPYWDNTGKDRMKTETEIADKQVRF